MIERNVGSAALIGGNAKLGGSAWGAEKTDGKDITFTARLIQFDTPVYPSEE